MGVDALNFALEFTDWKRLPLVVQQDLLDYGQQTTWTPKSKQCSYDLKEKPVCLPVCRLSVGNCSVCSGTVAKKVQ